MGISIRQTETDRNRHACRIGNCAWDHAKNTSLVKELEKERERESKTQKLTYGGRIKDKTQEREG